MLYAIFHLNPPQNTPNTHPALPPSQTHPASDSQSATARTPQTSHSQLFSSMVAVMISEILGKRIGEGECGNETQEFHRP